LPVGLRPLGLGHLADEKPLAREGLGGNEVPVRELIGLERKRRLGLLLGREAADELVGRVGHATDRPIGCRHRAGDKDQHEEKGEQEPRGAKGVQHLSPL
jgi:hypothetical protein